MVVRRALQRKKRANPANAASRFKKARRLGTTPGRVAEWLIWLTWERDAGYRTPQPAPEQQPRSRSHLDVMRVPQVRPSHPGSQRAWYRAADNG
jgi:hypothetical protein